MSMSEKADKTSGSILECLVKGNGEVYKMDDAFQWVVDRLNENLNQEGLKLEVRRDNTFINASWDIDIYEGDSTEWSIQFTYWEMNNDESTYAAFILDKINVEFKEIYTKTNVIDIY